MRLPGRSASPIRAPGGRRAWSARHGSRGRTAPSGSTCGRGPAPPRRRRRPRPPRATLAGRPRASSGSAAQPRRAERPLRPPVGRRRENSPPAAEAMSTGSPATQPATATVASVPSRTKCSSISPSIAGAPSRSISRWAREVTASITSSLRSARAEPRRRSSAGPRQGPAPALEANLLPGSSSRGTVLAGCGCRSVHRHTPGEA